MELARVVGTVVTPIQHPFYQGKKLLQVRGTDPRGVVRGPDRVAVDRVQAGVGDWVLVMREGSSARELFSDPRAPVRSVIVGVVDRADLVDGGFGARKGSQR